MSQHAGTRNYPELRVIWDAHEDPAVLERQLAQAYEDGALCVMGTPGCDCAPEEDHRD